MYHHMHDGNGWDWFWMVPMMVLWLVVLGGVIYAAVRLAIRDSHKRPGPPQPQ